MATVAAIRSGWPILFEVGGQLMSYEYYGQRNELIVSDKYDNYEMSNTPIVIDRVTTNPPRKGDAIDYQGATGTVLWIDRDFGEVNCLMHITKDVEVFPLDQFNDSEHKGRIKVWFLH